jgi:hypothetical protein
MSIINHLGVVRAQYVLSILQPAIQELQKVTNQSLSYNSDDFAQCQQVVAMLQRHVETANAVIQACNQHLDLLKANGLYDRVISRFFSIDGDIELNSWQLQSLKDDHNSKIEDLKHRGYTGAQINMIQPYPQAEIDELNNKIEKLKSDKKKFDEFIKSSPAFELSLLNGTEFGQQAEQAA